MPSIAKRAVPPLLPAMLDDRARHRLRRPTGAARDAALGALLLILTLGLAAVVLLMLNLASSAGAAGGCGGG